MFQYENNIADALNSVGGKGTFFLNVCPSYPPLLLPFSDVRLRMQTAPALDRIVGNCGQHTSSPRMVMLKMQGNNYACIYDNYQLVRNLHAQ